MIIHNFSTNNSLIQQFVAELRDHQIQNDKLKFKNNIERIGEILAYELSKILNYSTEVIKTPLGNKPMQVPIEKLVLCAVLRAGLPLHQGLANYFDKAENAFVSAYRLHKDGSDDFDVIVKYLAAPNLKNKTLVICDPMLATGKTIINVLEALKDHGEPNKIHIVSVIGSKKGIDHLNQVLPENVHLWISAIDDELNAKGYIVPGLGDAGDLSYGVKL